VHVILYIHLQYSVTDIKKTQKSVDLCFR